MCFSRLQYSLLKTDVMFTQPVIALMRKITRDVHMKCLPQYKGNNGSIHFSSISSLQLCLRKAAAQFTSDSHPNSSSMKKHYIELHCRWGLKESLLADDENLMPFFIGEMFSLF